MATEALKDFDNDLVKQVQQQRTSFLCSNGTSCQNLDKKMLINVSERNLVVVSLKISSSLSLILMNYYYLKETSLKTGTILSEGVKDHLFYFS